MTSEIYIIIYVLYAIAVAIVMIVAWLIYRSAKAQISKKESALPGVPAEYQRVWTGRYQNIPLIFYGGGCNQPFETYLQGQSQVTVNNVDEIADWLLGCRYISDAAQKGLRDQWQHPLDFEQTRCGDCEDYALWVWRKLVELNIRCEFMVGKWLHGGRAGTHAWVLLFDKDQATIFETTGVSKDRMFKPLELVAAEYVPFASIDNNVQKKVYVGIAKWILMLVNQKGK